MGATLFRRPGAHYANAANLRSKMVLACWLRRCRNRYPNKLYNKEPVDTDELEKVICLFRLDFIDEAAVTQSQAGKPVYMGIAMNDEKQLKLKPQNLLFNLPLAKVS